MNPTDGLTLDYLIVKTNEIDSSRSLGAMVKRFAAALRVVDYVAAVRTDKPSRKQIVLVQQARQEAVAHRARLEFGDQSLVVDGDLPQPAIGGGQA